MPNIVIRTDRATYEKQDPEDRSALMKELRYMVAKLATDMKAGEVFSPLNIEAGWILYEESDNTLGVLIIIEFSTGDCGFSPSFEQCEFVAKEINFYLEITTLLRAISDCGVWVDPHHNAAFRWGGKRGGI